MKVILTRDHNELGVNGSLIDVSEGYARNYLIPNNMAVRATKNVMAHYENRKKATAKKEAAAREQAQAYADKLSQLVVDVEANVGEEGRLYGTVTNKEVAEILKEKHDIDVNRRVIDIKTPIRTVGKYEVSIKVHPEISANITLNVFGDGPEEEEVVETPAAVQEEAPEVASEEAAVEA